MRKKHFISIEFCLTILLLALAGASDVNAQEHDLKLILPEDSVMVIKQILKKRFTQQLAQATAFNKSDAGYLQNVVGDSLVLDSLGKLVLLQLQQVKKSIINNGNTALNDGIQVSKDVLQQRLSALMQTQAVRNIIAEFTGIVKQPLLQWKDGILQTNGQTGTWMPNAANVEMKSSSLTGNWLVMGIPLGVQMLRQDLGGSATYSRNSFSFQFDKEAYLNSLRNKISLKIRQQDVFAYDQLLQEIKNRALARLKSSIDSISTVYKGKSGGLIDRLGMTNDLLNMNPVSIKAKLEELLTPQEVKHDPIVSVLHAGDSMYSPLNDSLRNVLADREGIDKIMNLINVFKTELQSNSALKKLEESSASAEQGMQQLINEPDKLKILAQEQLDLNGVQKLFLNIGHLKMGVHTVCLSPLSVNQFAINGISTSFYNNGKFLFLMMGKQAGLNNAFGNPQEFTLSPVSSSAMGISIGKGDIGADHAHLGIFRYDYGKASESNRLINTIPGHTVVTTLSNQFATGEASRLMFEVSRSAHSYNNQELIYDTLRGGSAVSKQLPGPQNILGQMAFMLQWNGTSEKKQLVYDLHIARTGEGYDNPGNLFIASGVTELGGNLRKELFGNRLQASAKLNYKDYQFSSIGSKWLTYNFSLQAKWKFKKAQYIAVRYQPCYSIHTQYDSGYTAAASNRLSIEGNFRKRFGAINYQHSIGLSVVRIHYTPDSIPSVNNGIDFSSMQTVGINKRSYYVSMQYNKSGNRPELMLFTAQFSAEAGCMYSIHNGVSCSTAIHYNSMQHWYRQTGVKQSISGQIGERFIVTVFADVQKKLKTYRPFYIGNTSFSWSLQYLLK